MAQKNSICVYCGSSEGSNPAFAAAAHALGSAIAAAGLGLVYGGGNIGLMGIVARSVLAAGGPVTGIIPDFLKKRENMLEGVDELIITQDMHERKMLMFDRADAFVALPGGIGTLEELVEQLTWSQLGRHTKPIIVANIDQFWQPMVSLFNHMHAEQFLRPGMELQFSVVDDIETVVPSIQKAWETQEEIVDDAEILRRF